MYEVIRPLPIGGRIIPPGTRITGEDLPEVNRRALISQRYIEPVVNPMRGVEAAEAVTPTASETPAVAGGTKPRIRRGQE